MHTSFATVLNYYSSNILVMEYTESDEGPGEEKDFLLRMIIKSFAIDFTERGFHVKLRFVFLARRASAEGPAQRPELCISPLR